MSHDVNLSNDNYPDVDTGHAKNIFAVSSKSRGIKKNYKDGMSSSDETCANSKRFTGHIKDKYK